MSLFFRRSGTLIMKKLAIISFIMFMFNLNICASENLNQQQPMYEYNQPQKQSDYYSQISQPNCTLRTYPKIN